MKRPFDYHLLSDKRQWEIDKKLGILDWDGTCGHVVIYGLCENCKKKYWKTHKSMKRRENKNKKGENHV